jgi:pantetheine-phosphate adenylyltransferase/dephospho-CoA kinase
LSSDLSANLTGVKWQSKMKTAIYAGSFDPVTLGHLDIIERAAAMFDKVIVVVGNNPAKKYIFQDHYRVQMIQVCVKAKNVEVVRLSSGLLADFAYEQGVRTLVKGVRNFQDYDYEKLMHEINISQHLGIETILLTSKATLSHVSSSAVKEIIKHDGFIHSYVPLPVKEAMEAAMRDQKIVGVTGVIGSGKSYLSESLHKEIWAIHNIDVDKIAHNIYERTEPVYVELRETIRATFNLKEFNRKELGQIVFNDSDALQELNRLMKEPILTRLRAEMGKFTGVILLNAALLVEFNLLHLCNNNVILVKCPEDVRAERLKARGMTDDQIKRRIACQYSQDEKELKIRNQIKKDGWGGLTVWNGGTDRVDWLASALFNGRGLPILDYKIKNKSN